MEHAITSILCAFLTYLLIFFLNVKFTCNMCVCVCVCILSGDLLIILAQIISAIQFVYEERFIKKHNFHPLLVVGLEGNLFKFIRIYANFEIQTHPMLTVIKLMVIFLLLFDVQGFYFLLFYFFSCKLFMLLITSVHFNRWCKNWRLGSVVRTSVFGLRTSLIYAWSMADMWPLCG